MTAPQILLLIAAAWLLIVAVFHLVLAPIWRRVPRGDALTGFMWWICVSYSRLVHRVTFSGRHLLPRSFDDHQTAARTLSELGFHVDD